MVIIGYEDELTIDVEEIVAVRSAPNRVVCG